MVRKRYLALSALIVALGAILGAQASLVAKNERILEFDTMVGNTQAFTGAQNPIRGINGGGLPWMVERARGELTTSGDLDIRIDGLVLASGPNAGTNPVPSFRAIVSCLGGDASIQNVTTAAFPATTGPASAGGGDARIQADVALPQPCIAPIIFVTSPTGAWFAATGH